MILFCFAVLIGFLLLAWSADRFVDGASSIARILGVPPMIIGLTIVSLGTSAPEIVVAILAAIDGTPGMAIGNALGSNIANIGLVLGLTALIAPLTVRSQLIKRELPILFLVMLLALGLMLDGELSRIDGFVLLAGLVMLFWWLTRLGMRDRKDALQSEFSESIPASQSVQKSVLWFFTGLIVLVLASRLVVWGAVHIAQTFGVSDLVIGLTIVAIGTSLPEVMACIVSVLKNEPDIAIGNVLGSNMVNILAVLSMPALIDPQIFEAEALYRDMPVMFAFTFALFLVAYGFRGPGRINRIEGGVLLSGFCAYLLLLYVMSS
jgi:cation:H+ antiporter